MREPAHNNRLAIYPGPQKRSEAEDAHGTPGSGPSHDPHISPASFAPAIRTAYRRGTPLWFYLLAPLGDGCISCGVSTGPAGWVARDSCGERPRLRAGQVLARQARISVRSGKLARG
jgi:hypothetical protein